ncbi:MAG: DUF21 domain-containing protein [Euryarchaeota archaeon]|nr:DUF21 domain-containing protein [Euryarchaeota archaeon]
MISSTVTVAGIGATLGLLLLSAFFSSSEIAIFSLSADQIDRLAATGDADARLLQELRTNPHRLLVTLLVGNNIVNIAISSIITVLVISYVPAGTAVVVTTLVTSLVILIFGEIVPKAFGLGNAERWSLRVIGPVQFVERALSPLISVLEAITGRLNALLSADSEIEKPYLD